ncbi:MAG: hypothetical protein ABSB89_01025 [Candidatus Bathyarchaeia archaeon]|jgi:hypothetical protein
MSEENQDKKVKVQIDVNNKGTEELVKLLKEKEAKENEGFDLAGKIAEANEKFHTQMFSQAQNRQMLASMITSFVNDIASRTNPTPPSTGTAPLNDAQYGARPQDLYTKPYTDFQSLVKDLREKARSGSKEAESYLNSLFEKHRELKMQDPHRPEPSYNPNSPEALEELNLVKKDGFLTPSKVEDGDLGQLQKKWREERKRQKEEGEVKA